MQETQRLNPPSRPDSSTRRPWIEPHLQCESLEVTQQKGKIAISAIEATVIGLGLIGPAS